VVVFDAPKRDSYTGQSPAGRPPQTTFSSPPAAGSRLSGSDGHSSIDMDALGPLPGPRKSNQMFVQPDNRNMQPDQTPLAARTKRITYGHRTPLKTEVSYVALVLVLLYIGALGYYIYIRLRYSMDMVNYPG
jgi:hypothetical protein